MLITHIYYISQTHIPKTQHSLSHSLNLLLLVHSVCPNSETSDFLYNSLLLYSMPYKFYHQIDHHYHWDKISILTTAHKTPIYLSDFIFHHTNTCHSSSQTQFYQP